MIGQRKARNESHHHETQDLEPRGRAVLLGSLTPLLSAWALLPNKVSCFVSSCVSSEISFLSVRQEPTLGPWKGSPFPQHFKRYMGTASGHLVISRVGVVARAPRRTNLFDAQRTFPSRPCHFCLFLPPGFKIVQGQPAPQILSYPCKGRVCLAPPEKASVPLCF